MKSSGIPTKIPTVYTYSEILVMLFIILLLTFLWKVRKNRTWFSVVSIPRIPFHSALLELARKVLVNNLSFNNALFQTLNTVSKRFEKEGLFQLWLFRRIVFIFNEETVKEFATNEASADKPTDYDVVKEVAGEGLVTSNGELWRNDRKNLNPIFYTGNLKKKLPILNKNAMLLVKSLAEIADKRTLHLHPSISTYVFHNLFEAVFGMNFKDTEIGITIPEWHKRMENIAEYINSRWLFPPMIAKFLKFCTPSGWKYLKLWDETMQYTEKVISAMEESSACSSRNSESLFEVLSKNCMNNPSSTSKYIKDHICTFEGATDTAIITIVWSLFLLGHHKDVQEKAFEEVESITDEIVTFEDLCRLEYLECIIKETLRLYPAVPIFGRHLNKDIQCGKYTVPKDTTIVFFLYRLHRNPEIYADPEKFIPERFCSENTEKRKWAYIPFSEGYRSCIGKKFAMMEMKMALFYILRHYEIASLDKMENVDLNWKITLIPSKPLSMRLSPRNVQADSVCRKE